jgi:hypothetical protein
MGELLIFRKTVANVQPEICLRPGVGYPDWSAVDSTAVRGALGAMLGASDAARRWSGIAEPEDRVRRAVLDHYAETGYPPSVARLTAATGLEPEDVRRILGALAARDVIALGVSGVTITGAAPFTESDTPHSVCLGGHEINTTGAIDALGAGIMCQRKVRIDSLCPACGGAIQLETRERGAALGRATPRGTVVWMGSDLVGDDAAAPSNPMTAFFCARDHLAAWRKLAGTGAAGVRLSLDEALQAAKALFGPLLAPAI